MLECEWRVFSFYHSFRYSVEIYVFNGKLIEETYRVRVSGVAYYNVFDLDVESRSVEIWYLVEGGIQSIEKSSD